MILLNECKIFGRYSCHTNYSFKKAGVNQIREHQKPHHNAKYSLFLANKCLITYTHENSCIYNNLNRPRDKYKRKRIKNVYDVDASCRRCINIHYKLDVKLTLDIKTN